MPIKYGVDKSLNSTEGLSAYQNGGPGSGNFGHSGREGQVGGSAPRGVSATSLHASRQQTSPQTIESQQRQELYDRLDDEKALNEILSPTEKLSKETLQRGRKQINKAMEIADERLRNGEKKVTTNGQEYVPEYKDSQILATPLNGDVEYDIICSVQGQLSDGIWENSPAMESYWRMSNMVKGDDGKTYIDVSKQLDYVDYKDHRGVNHWKNNKYANMTNAGVRNFWADKIKQVVDIERSDSKRYSGNYGTDYSWRPDNNTELQYMHSYKNEGKNPTVGDAYKVWAKLGAPEGAKLKRNPFDYSEENY